MTKQQYLSLRKGDKVLVRIPSTIVFNQQGDSNNITSTILPLFANNIASPMRAMNNTIITIHRAPTDRDQAQCTDRWAWLPEWIELPYKIKEL